MREKAPHTTRVRQHSSSLLRTDSRSDTQKQKQTKRRQVTQGKTEGGMYAILAATIYKRDDGGGTQRTGQNIGKGAD